ncbi:MAG: hypothetical protein ACTSR8_21120 [Promethearchaeota archaeon]
MNRSKSLLFSLFILLSASFYCQIVYAALQDHLSFNANDEFIWTVEMDKEGLDSFEEDFTVPEEYHFNKDLQEFKVKISSIGKEKEHNGTKISEIEINYDENENSREVEWERNKDKSETIVYAYEKEVYAEGYFLLKLIYGAVLFIPNNVDWKEVAKEAEKNLEADVTLDEFEIRALDAGLELMLKYEDARELKLSIEYSSAGVLSAYRLEYNDMLVMESTLETLIIPWEIIVGLIILIAAVIIGGYVFIIRPRYSLRNWLKNSNFLSRVHFSFRSKNKDKKEYSSPKKKLKRIHAIPPSPKNIAVKTKDSPESTSDPMENNAINEDLTSQVRTFLIDIERENIRISPTETCSQSSTPCIKKSDDEEGIDKLRARIINKVYIEPHITGLLVSNTFNRPYGKYTVCAKFGQFDKEESKELFSTLMAGSEHEYFILTEHPEQDITELYWIEHEKKNVKKDEKDTSKTCLVKRVSGQIFGLKQIFEKYLD